MRDRKDYAGCESAYHRGWDASAASSSMFRERDLLAALDQALTSDLTVLADVRAFLLGAADELADR